MTGSIGIFHAGRSIAAGSARSNLVDSASSVTRLMCIWKLKLGPSWAQTSPDHRGIHFLQGSNLAITRLTIQMCALGVPKSSPEKPHQPTRNYSKLDVNPMLTGENNDRSALLYSNLCRHYTLTSSRSSKLL